MDSQQDLLRRIALLEHKLETLADSRVGILEDVEAIKRLQRTYGYYVDMCLWDPMTDLFSEKGCSFEIGRRGRYEGKENIRKFLWDVDAGGRGAGLLPGQVINHMQAQGIVTVNGDRQHAQGRWRAVVQAGSPPPAQSAASSAPGPRGPSPLGPPSGPPVFTGAMMYEEGAYENTYVKENGIWKLQTLCWVPTFYVSHPYTAMWQESGPASTAFPPQRAPLPDFPGLGRQFLPFHFRHPVTHEPVTQVTHVDPPAKS